MMSLIARCPRQSLKSIHSGSEDIWWLSCTAELSQQQRWGLQRSSPKRPLPLEQHQYLWTNNLREEEGQVISQLNDSLLAQPFSYYFIYWEVREPRNECVIDAEQRWSHSGNSSLQKTNHRWIFSAGLGLKVFGMKVWKVACWVCCCSEVELHALFYIYWPKTNIID